MHRNSVNFMKITTEFTNFGCEFCLVSRPNNNNSHLTPSSQAYCTSSELGLDKV